MTVEMIKEVLLYCTLINVGILFWWAGFLMFAHDWVYQLHSRWFKLSVERFDSIHYAAMAFFKLGFFMLNLVPYLALEIVT